MEPANEPRVLTIQLVASDIEDAYMKLIKKITELLPKEASYFIDMFDAESNIYSYLEVNAVVHYWWDVLDGKGQNV